MEEFFYRVKVWYNCIVKRELKNPYHSDYKYKVLKEFEFEFVGKKYVLKLGDVISSRYYAHAQYVLDIHRLDGFVVITAE